MNRQVKSKIFHYGFLPKSHRGSIEIVLLVLLVLLVTSVALFNFIVGSKSIQANIYDARFIEGVYQKQDLAEFYIRQVGEEVIAKNSGDFSESFKTEFSKYDFDQGDLKELQKIISEGGFNVREFELTPKGNVLEITINSWELKDFAPKGVHRLTAFPAREPLTRHQGGASSSSSPSVKEDINTEGKKIEVSYFPKISLKFDLKN